MKAHLGTILSITTDIHLAPGGFGDIHELLDYLTSDTLFTHQLIRASDETRDHLIAQLPWLAEITPPGEFADENHVWRWLTVQTDRYGMWHDVEPMAAEDHTRIDPLTEMRMLRPDMDVVAVEVPDQQERS